MVRENKIMPRTPSPLLDHFGPEPTPATFASVAIDPIRKSVSIATTKTTMVTVVFRPPREVAGWNMAGAFRRGTRRAIQILFARPLRRPHLPSGRLYGDRTKIVALGDVNAAMAQNCIGGCDMEMEVRQ